MTNATWIRQREEHTWMMLAAAELDRLYERLRGSGFGFLLTGLPRKALPRCQPPHARTPRATH